MKSRELSPRRSRILLELQALGQKSRHSGGEDAAHFPQVRWEMGERDGSWLGPVDHGWSEDPLGRELRERNSRALRSRVAGKVRELNTARLRDVP